MSKILLREGCLNMHKDEFMKLLHDVLAKETDIEKIKVVYKNGEELKIGFDEEEDDEVDIVINTEDVVADDDNDDDDDDDDDDDGDDDDDDDDDEVDDIQRTLEKVVTNSSSIPQSALTTRRNVNIINR